MSFPQNFRLTAALSVLVSTYAFSPHVLAEVCDFRVAQARYGAACQQRHSIASTEYTGCVCDALESGTPPPLASPPTRSDPASLETRLTAAYGERCQLAGYRPGSGAFGQCLLAYDERAADGQSQIDAQRRALLLSLYLQQRGQWAQEQSARDAQMRAMQQRLLTPPAPGALCTAVVGNQLVSRPCY